MKGPLPLISEESEHSGLVPAPCPERSHVHQLREVLLAGRISTVEPGAHLRRPGELENLLGAANIVLEMTPKDLQVTHRCTSPPQTGV